MKTNCAGECFYNDIRLEYHIQVLDYVVDKHLNLECVCLNPHNPLDREMSFKFTTQNSKVLDEKGQIAMSIVVSLMNDLELDQTKLRKLTVKDKQVYWICLAQEHKATT